jgi:hypothetical protein
MNLTRSFKLLVSAIRSIAISRLRIINLDEWHSLAYYEIDELTKRGLPGVWTHGFYDGWAPNYMMFIANLRNSIGRFYETYTSFGAECDTARIGEPQRSVEWFRPNPPLDGVRWCIRNNINYQQSGAILALSYVAEHAGAFLENFWIKSRRAVERGRTAKTNLWHIPAEQPRRVEAAELVNLLRLQGIEVHRAAAAFSAGGVSIAAGDYLVRMDQPYGPLAADLLGALGLCFAGLGGADDGDKELWCCHENGRIITPMLRLG